MFVFLIVSHHSAGAAVGLFVYGVSEPLRHQNYHWFAEAGYHSQDEIDMFAINLTVTNWCRLGAILGRRGLYGTRWTPLQPASNFPQLSIPHSSRIHMGVDW
jgi:hypothetical protein